MTELSIKEKPFLKINEGKGFLVYSTNYNYKFVKHF